VERPKGDSEMKGKRGVVAVAVLVAVLAVSVSVVPSAAQEPPPPIATEFLTDRAVFTDKVRLRFKVKFQGLPREVVSLRPSHTVVARFTVQPGAQFPWHSHAGPVVVNVVSGELTYIAAEDCVEREYPAGTAFVDPGRGHVHSAFNDTDEVTVFVATFFGAPAEGPLLIPADDPGCS
jgi:quercetin dioxygenase-like cupin family protein